MGLERLAGVAGAGGAVLEEAAWRGEAACARGSALAGGDDVGGRDGEGRTDDGGRRTDDGGRVDDAVGMAGASWEVVPYRALSDLVILHELDEDGLLITHVIRLDFARGPFSNGALFDECRKVASLPWRGLRRRVPAGVKWAWCVGWVWPSLLELLKEVINHLQKRFVYHYQLDPHEEDDHLIVCHLNFDAHSWPFPCLHIHRNQSPLRAPSRDRT